MQQNILNEYNKSTTQSLLRTLKIGHYPYYNTDELLSTETAVMVQNISSKDMINLCNRYKQGRMFFIDMSTGNDVSCKYWAYNDVQSQLKLKHEEHRFIYAKDDDEFYTKIGHELKFGKSFVGCIKNTVSSIQSNGDKYDVNKLIDESIDDKYTGKHKYFCRCKLYHIEYGKFL